MQEQGNEHTLSGQSLALYTDLFALSEKDLSKKILEVGGGMSSFNAEYASAVSCDALYAESLSVLQERSALCRDAEHATIAALIKNSAEQHTLIDDYDRAVRLFLEDFELGVKEGRYRSDALPSLPFENNAFDLALHPNYLFNNNMLDVELHVNSISELCRVAGEVRLLPERAMQGDVGQFWGPVMLALQSKNYGVELREVSGWGGRLNRMMVRVWAETCAID